MVLRYSVMSSRQLKGCGRIAIYGTIVFRSLYRMRTPLDSTAPPLGAPYYRPSAVSILLPYRAPFSASILRCERTKVPHRGTNRAALGRLAALALGRPIAKTTFHLLFAFLRLGRTNFSATVGDVFRS